MSQKKYTDEELKDAISMGLSAADIARKFNVDPRGVIRRKQRLIQQGFAPEHDWVKEAPDGYKIKGTSTLYHCGLDKDGNPIRVASNQWVKINIDKERQLEILQELCHSLVRELPKVSPCNVLNRSDIGDDTLTVYPLSDPHIGMFSWGKETGNDWDLKIAEQYYNDLFDRVVKAAPRSKYCVLASLGDLFHADNFEQATSRHNNKLDCDNRYPKMVDIVMIIIRRMITACLEHHENVHIKIVQGNHDDVSSIFLAIALKHIYENEPRVEVDDSPDVFKYYKFGKVLLGFHHGHTCKMDDLPGVMAADRAIDWGETKYRMWMTGHIHKDTRIEKGGCIVESYRIVAPNDNYAHSGGWRSGRDMKALVFNRNRGHRFTQITPIDCFGDGE